MSVMGIGPGRLFGPISDVTGFSERDGLTHLEIQRRMREKLLELIAAHNTLANNQRVLNANIVTNSDFVNSIVEGRTGPVIMGGVNGIVADGITDNTAAIQAIVNSATEGTTITLVATGEPVLVEGTVTVDTPNLTFTSFSTDVHGVHFKRTAPGLMFLIRAGGVRFNGVHFEGNGGDYGQDATCDALMFYGDTSANVDAWVLDCMFLHMNKCVEVHGRNIVIDRNTFNNSRQAVIDSGPVGGYHVGTWLNRGLRVNNNRMHGMGIDGDKIVYVTNTAVLTHGEIDNNYYDINSFGNPVVIDGLADALNVYVSVKNNKIMNVMRDAIVLNYAQHCTISDNDISAGSHHNSTAVGISINNCVNLNLNDNLITQMRAVGLLVRNSSGIRVNGLLLRGIDANGVDIDSSVSYSVIRDLTTYNITGYAVTGSPATTKLISADLQGGDLGGIDSDTLTNIIPTDSITLGAADGWFVVGGTPALANVSSFPVMAFDAASDEQISKLIEIPKSWHKFSIDLLWSASDATAGKVIWGIDVNALDDGSPIASGSPIGVTLTPDGTNIVRTRIATGVDNTAKNYGARIYRQGTNVNDTYAADARFLGLIITRYPW